jgi:vitamin B12 transporter
MTRSSTIALLSLLPSLASAQVARDTAHTAPIVVTATRSPIATTQSPSSVSVLNGDELRRAGITTVLDALRQVPGIAVVQTGSYGGATSLFIRGGESKFAKVLVDGVPVNDAGGAFDFSALSTDNLDRIEIVRGPASVLYGSDAMAGVVQLFTRRGAGTPRLDVSARGGGYASYDGDASVRGALDAIDYSISGARHHTGGIQAFNSAFGQSVGSAMLGWRASAADARFTARYTDDTFNFPTDGSGQTVDSNAVRRDDRLSVGLDAGYRLSSAAEIRVAVAGSSGHAITDDQADSPGDNQGYYYTTGDRSYRRSAELRANLALTDMLQATIGSQVERQWQTSATTSNYGPSGYSARRRNTGLFAQLLAGGSQAYTGTLGARYDHNEAFGDFFTYRAAGSVAVTDETRLHASVGTAFREPTMLENFGGGFVIGNPALSPEQARSFDLGVEQAIDARSTVSATIFGNSFTNLIDYKYSDTQPNYFNIARTRSVGLELEGRTVLPNSFFVDASYSYVDAKVVDPGESNATTAAFAPGAQLLRRPKHSFDAGVAYRPNGASFGNRAHRVGEREDVYFAPDFSSKRVTLPAYVRTDASADVPVLSENGRSATVTLRAENLFDVRYADLAGYNTDFARTDDASLRLTGYRAPGRRILAGLRITM